MAARKRTKKYDLSNLADNFKLLDLSEDKLIDDNDSDRKNYFSDSKFENDTYAVAHLQSAASLYLVVTHIGKTCEIYAFTIRRVSVYRENFPAVNVLIT